MNAVEESATFDKWSFEALAERKPGNLTHLTYFYVPKEDLMFAPVLGLYLRTEFNRMRRASLLKGMFVPRQVWIRLYDQDGDNFVRNMVTVVIYHNKIRIPRFLAKLKLSRLPKIKCH